MPTGAPFRIPPPNGILLADPLENDLGGMLPESLNLVARFGSLRSRPGLTVLGQALAADEPVLGGYWTRDKSGVIRLIIGTDRRWWQFDNTTLQWVDISGGVALTGSVGVPSTFQYWEEGDNQYVIGVNGVNAAKEFQIGGAAYADVSGGYIAETVSSIASRLMYGNVTIGGIRFPTMVAWTGAGQRGVNPALARNKLIDSGDHIRAVRRVNRLNAAIYRERSVWTATAVAADDAHAFQFTVADQRPGPCSPMAVAEDPGYLHIYFGSDLNLWSFDGTQCQMLAATCDLLMGRFNPASQGLVNMAVCPSHLEVWVSLPLDGEVLPTWAMIYSLITKGVFLVKFPSAMALTSLFSWQLELTTPTHLLPDVPTHELPNVPTHQLGFIGGQEILTVGSVGGVYTADGITDDGEEIPVEWRHLLPMAPGGDHVFDAVELMILPPGGPLTVSVLTGPTYDYLTETVLGVIDPSLTPPAGRPVPYTQGGPNLSVVRANREIRAPIVVVRVVGTMSQLLKIRRAEIFSYGRRQPV